MATPATDYRHASESAVLVKHIRGHRVYVLDLSAIRIQTRHQPEGLLIDVVPHLLASASWRRVISLRLGYSCSESEKQASPGCWCPAATGCGWAGRTVCAQVGCKRGRQVREYAQPHDDSAYKVARLDLSSRLALASSNRPQVCSSTPCPRCVSMHAAERNGAR